MKTMHKDDQIQNKNIVCDHHKQKNPFYIATCTAFHAESAPFFFQTTDIASHK